LFQLLKYFPGRWEIVGRDRDPGLVMGFLAFLPWLEIVAARAKPSVAWPFCCRSPPDWWRW
jgi:hypothetical protein